MFYLLFITLKYASSRHHTFVKTADICKDLQTTIYGGGKIHWMWVSVSIWWYRRTDPSICLSNYLPVLSPSQRSQTCIITVFWDLTSASFTALSLSSETNKTKTHTRTPPHHGNPLGVEGWVGGSVFKCHLDPSFSSSVLLPYSALHTHSCHPTPSCINASNPLCGRVTSATVRNRVKLNRHRENGRGRSSTDNQAALHSGPPLGLWHLGKTWRSLRSGCSCLQLESHTVIINFINRLAENLPSWLEGLIGIKIQGWELTKRNAKSLLGKQYCFNGHLLLLLKY